MTSIVPDGPRGSDALRGLDVVAREGGRRLLAAALEAEVAEHLATARGERDENGHALVVRNGHARQREVATVARAVPVAAPRVNDRRVDEESGERRRFRSAILLPYARRSASGHRGARHLLEAAKQESDLPSTTRCAQLVVDEALHLNSAELLRLLQ